MYIFRVCSIINIILIKENNLLMIIENTEAGRIVQRVAATMAIEDMYLSNEFIEKLLKVNNGEMTTDDLIQELNDKYAK